MSAKTKRSTEETRETAFEEVNSVLFRRPALDVRGTAFVRHVGFWMKPGSNPLMEPRKAQSATCAKQMLDLLNSLIRLIVGDRPHAGDRPELNGFHIKMQTLHTTKREWGPALHLDPDYDEEQFSKLRDSDIVLLSPKDSERGSDTFLSEAFLWNNFRLRLRSDTHLEYFTLTILVDEAPVVASDEQKQASEMAFGKDFWERVQRASDIMSPGGGMVTSTSWAGNLDVDIGFTGIWKELHKHLRERHHASPEFFKPQAGFPIDKLIDLLDEGDPGLQAERFADFRGVSIALDAPKANPAPASPDGQPAEDKMLWDFAPLDFARNSGAQGQALEQAFDRQKNYLLKGEDYLKQALRVESQTEIVLTGLLDGWAVYASTLGRDQVGPGRRRIEPTRYILTYAGGIPYQRGRLTRALHEAGVLRIMALRDLVYVRLAGQEFRQIAQELSAGQDGIFSVKPYLKGLYQRYQAALRLTAGGLVYRSGRSRHYVLHWTKAVDELRQRRIEGWQPYDEFIQRRLYSVFEYIGRTGDRATILSQQFATAFAMEQGTSARNLSLIAAVFALPSGVIAIAQFLETEFGVTGADNIGIVFLMSAFLVATFGTETIIPIIGKFLKSLGLAALAPMFFTRLGQFLTLAAIGLPLFFSGLFMFFCVPDAPPEPPPAAPPVPPVK